MSLPTDVAVHRQRSDVLAITSMAQCTSISSLVARRGARRNQRARPTYVRPTLISLVLAPRGNRRGPAGSYAPLAAQQHLGHWRPVASDLLACVLTRKVDTAGAGARF